jgi:hypothetical protein
MNYSDAVNFLAEHFIFPVTDASSATPSSDSDINDALPKIFDSAEQRIYVEMDMLANRGSDYSKTCVVGNREVALPTGTIVTEGINIVSQMGSQFRQSHQKVRVTLVIELLLTSSTLAIHKRM